ncbi:MAG: GxxExxY protein [Bacteroidales bacterium]|nr:GxxExxY protein [Bacteroidales bacterium]MBK9359421.1 GxxExxY protein [Bacteroidales bacterium]
MNRADLNRLHTKVFEAASEVLTELGPGLDEQIYRSCFLHELRLQGLMFKRDVIFPVFYKDLKTNNEYKAEILVENQLIVEIINESGINPLRITAMQSKLKLSGKRLGVIISFNCAAITDGYRKIIVNP